MIVSYRHRFVFLKVPKTAGTSVELFLDPIAGHDAIVTRNPLHRDTEPRNAANTPAVIARALWAGRDDREAVARTWTAVRRRQPLFYNHMPARLVRERIGAKTFDGFYRFCFDRNPWEKSISRYFWRTRKLSVRPPFDDWALVPGNLPSARRLYTIGGDLAADFVGRYETLTDDLAHVMDQLGVVAPIDLPRANAGVRPKNERTAVGKRADAAIRAAFGWELDRFGWERPGGIPWE